MIDDIYMRDFKARIKEDGRVIVFRYSHTILDTGERVFSFRGGQAKESEIEFVEWLVKDPEDT